MERIICKMTELQEGQVKVRFAGSGRTIYEKTELWDDQVIRRLSYGNIVNYSRVMYACDSV